MPRVPYKMLLEPVPPVHLGSGNTALLLMDVQHLTTTRERGLGRLAQARGISTEFDEYYAQVEAALRNLRRLRAACKARGIPVIYTLLHAAHPGALSRQLRATGLPIPGGAPADEIRPELAPDPEDAILPRGTYSPFAGTPLARDLHAGGVDTLLLAGMLANLSVALAAREAADRGFNGVVVWDASASETLAWHESFKERIVGGLIRVRSTPQVLEMLEGVRT
jgi:nicotinamidase-related amidase